MQCPKCRHDSTRVIDSREGADGRAVRRRRECESCDYRFTTFERVEESLPLVVKKGGAREAFDRQKILNGLRKACEKRPVGIEAMEQVVRDIEAQLLETGEKEVSSQRLGEMVIERLEGLDQVAYVRFASVYREFSDVSEFMDALRTLVTQTSPGSLPSELAKVQNKKRRPTDKSTEQLSFDTVSRKGKADVE